MPTNPPIEYLRQCFTLTPEGRLFWRDRPRAHFPTERGWRCFNSQHADREAFLKENGPGYSSTDLIFNGRRCSLLAHRVVFALHYGRWPKNKVDHRDTAKRNNAPSNLREATDLQNNGNTKARRNNKLGVKGVVQVRSGRFSAFIKDPKTRSLGTFDTIAEASAAYERAAIAYWGEFARATP